VRQHCLVIDADAAWAAAWETLAAEGFADDWGSRECCRAYLAWIADGSPADVLAWLLDSSTWTIPAAEDQP
jgi:hypothetical protein